MWPTALAIRSSSPNSGLSSRIVAMLCRWNDLTSVKGVTRVDFWTSCKSFGRLRCQDLRGRRVGEEKLASIDKLQKDIGQIRTWPFDIQILERLVAIIVTVIAIMVAHYIQVALP